MRKIATIFTALYLLLNSSYALAENALSPKQWVKAMTQAQQTQSYQMLFVHSNLAELSSFRYQQVSFKQKMYAQLSHLNGMQQDILRRENLVSYFPTHFPPFTLQSQQIVDYLPNVININVDKLAAYYDFTSVGRNRIADRLTQVVKMMPKDSFRHQYVLFIDEQTQLLLRSDLLDPNGNLLESFYVIDLNLNTDDKNQAFVERLTAVHFPPLLEDDKKSQPALSHWQPQWLPQGFKLIKATISPENKDSDKLIESRLYSDGLFSFTIYVADKLTDSIQENQWQQGTNVIYNENIGDKEITLIGQLPATTAKRIVQDIKFQ